MMETKTIYVVSGPEFARYHIEGFTMLLGHLASYLDEMCHGEEIRFTIECKEMADEQLEALVEF